MTPKDFSELLQRRINLTRSTLDKKSQEYAIDSDKLHNFKFTGIVKNVHPAVAADWYMTKHIISYFDMLRDIQNGKKFTREYLDEKFGDIINYMILQEAIFVETALSID